MQIAIPAVVMRGGTSRALFFKEDDLPAERTRWESLFLSALGSPDETGRQIDGLGGGVSSSSKVAVIAPSTDPRYDVVYFFGQVAIDRPFVDFTGNCGNISSAVAPFAVDEGMVAATEPFTTVRIHQKNTDKLIVARIAVSGGRFDPAGDYAIPGITGSGSRITLHFEDPGGSLTGKLLPTGSAVDWLENIEGVERTACSIVDAGNPFVFVRADDLGIDSNTPAVFADRHVAARLEAIRARAAVMLGLAPDEAAASRISPAVPKIAVVSPPAAYQTMGSRSIDRSALDITIRCLSMGTLHKALPGTGAVAAAGAAKIPGSIVNQVLADDCTGSEMVRLGHPSGVMEAGSAVDIRDGVAHYQRATIFRTARRIMEGTIWVAPSR